MSNKSLFNLVANYSPSNDQKNAVDELVSGLDQGKKDQVLLGVTGSGKTFTMANVIQKAQRPTVIIVHNKTLAAQLYNEMKGFFPDNAVEYFVSYYDYYQPEAYVPKTDTFIEKDSLINGKIDALRHSTLISLLERRDIIVITSVSGIYALGSPKIYRELSFSIEVGMDMPRDMLLKKFVSLEYSRNDMELTRGCFRVRGDVVDIVPSYSDSVGFRIEAFDDEIESIYEVDIVTGKKIRSRDKINVYPNTYYASSPELMQSIIKPILSEMRGVVKHFKSLAKEIEAQRIEQRTRYDMEMIASIGTHKGIENYSRYIDGRKEGEPPYTLFHYLQNDSLLFVDESHVTLGQIKGMISSDRSRKEKLVGHGFRLPSALDNRPLAYEEWDNIRCQTIHISATPGPKELEYTDGCVVEQIIRPTGLLDPVCVVKPTENQIDDMVSEINIAIKENLRAMIIVLTKKMAEQVYQYFLELGFKVMYIHSDTDTLERIKIIKDLREGRIDIIIGINLLREGLDIPECGLICVSDADKAGFLRSKTSLIQIIGRAARNSNGRVIMYADKMTEALDYALKETSRRREMQIQHNTKHGITPKTIIKSTESQLEDIFGKKKVTKKQNLNDPKELKKLIEEYSKEMHAAADILDFEKASNLRDQVLKFKKMLKVSSSKK